MFKKFIQINILSMLFFITISHANGFYIGGGIGYDQANTNINSNWSISSLAIFPLTGFGLAVNGNGSNAAKLHGQSLSGDLIIGYAVDLFQQFYLGSELMAFWTHARDQNTQTMVLTNDWFNLANPNNRLFNQLGENSTIQNKLHYGYGLILRPGYYLANNVILYGIAGIMRSKFNASLAQGESGFIIGEEAGGSRLTNPLMFNQTLWRNGFTYGAGLEVKLTHQLSLRAQVAQIRYKAFTINSSNISNGATDEGGALTINNTSSITFKPVETTTLINLIWNLGSDQKSK